MKSIFALIPCLILALPGCLEQQEPSDGALVLPGQPLPPLSGDAQPVREPSLIQGFDPAAPDESIAGIIDGLSPSKLRFESDRLELGEIYQFEHQEFEFPFIVDGDESVVITHIEANCGCTDGRIRADWEAKPGEEAPGYVLGREIPPGARGTVIGTFDSQRYNGIKITTITIRGNMADTPQKLELHVKIRPAFDVKPPQVRFGEVLAGPGKGPRPTQDIRVVAREPFEVLEWRRLPPGLKIEPIGEGASTGYLNEWARSFRITLGGDAPEGAMQTSAAAATSMGNDLDIMVSAMVVGPIKYTPTNRLAFGFPDQGEERTRTVEIQASMDGLEIPAPKIEIEGEAAKFLTSEVEVIEAGRLLRVKVTMPGTTPVGSYSGALKLIYPADSGIASRDFVISARVREKRG
ncbi:MAG: DUF1573 domain-containing protein [Planctomycetota bacterium]|nr:DUF1573 domain-containing protein [Planctomycetota bacterium]